MAKIKVQLQGEEKVSLFSNENAVGLPKDFSLEICGYSHNAGEEDEPEVIAVLLDRYELHELILKMEMILRNQVK